VAGSKHVFASTLTWTGGPSTRDYVVRTADGAEIAGSAPVMFKGDGTRASPEDMTVAALSACQMLTYLAFCARKGITVVAYEDRAEGTLDRVGPGKIKFVDVVLRPRVRVADAKDVAAAAALHHDAHEACFVANSVNFPVRVEPAVTAS
jgi:organic hydroperoxide reductase OsmC/OhrA